MSARALVLALAAAVVAVAIAAAAARAAGCNGDPRLCDKRFDRVVLPGAHNAMSAAEAGFRFPNQRIAIPKQLAFGIRALLIDVYPGPAGLVECHLTCDNGSTPLADTLRAVADFLAAHPDDVVLFDVEDHAPAEDIAAAFEGAGLGAMAYSGSTSRWPTLRSMVAANQRVVVLAEQRAGVRPWYRPAYQGIVQETPYSWAKPSLLTKKANWRASCKPNRGGTRGSLFLMNHWAPPFAPKAATSAQVNAKRAIVGRALACRRRRGRMPTIVAADMVDVGSLIPAVRQLNRLVGG